MSYRASRRQFLSTSALAGIGFWTCGRAAQAKEAGPNEKLNLGIIGVDGRGGANLAEVSQTENIVALCDIDANRLGKAAEKFPQAKKYRDFRKMLEQTGIDAVVLSTPDHTHAVAGVMAMKLGKHLYCEKPLAHSVWEARTMRDTAAAAKVATQMGNQGHAMDRLRKVVEVVRSGDIGPVHEVICWSKKKFSGGERPKETPPVPDSIDWDLWLGPAPVRPYHPTYIPFYWRGWWDFGEGNYGDMACHIIDAAYWALDLKYPTAVEAEGPPVHPECTPTALVVRYEFPARGEQPPVKLTWYDGDKAPPMPSVEGIPLPDQGSLLIGREGKILFPHHTGPIYLLPQSQFADYKVPEPMLPRPASHHQEWIAACKGGEPSYSNFNYAAALTETVMAGIVAYRTGTRLVWNGEAMKAENCPDAETFIKPAYRKGWTL